MSKAKQPVGKLKSSPTSNISGVKFLKAFAPSIRRRRQCDKEKLEIYNIEAANNENFNVWDAIPASPITPPAAFLPPGYRRSGKKNPWTLFNLHRRSMQMGLDLKKNSTSSFFCWAKCYRVRKKDEKINSRFSYTAQHHGKCLFVHCLFYIANSSCSQQNYLTLPLQAANPARSLCSCDAKL